MIERSRRCARLPTSVRRVREGFSVPFASPHSDLAARFCWVELKQSKLEAITSNGMLTRPLYAGVKDAAWRRWCSHKALGGCSIGGKVGGLTPLGIGRRERRI